MQCEGCKTFVYEKDMETHGIPRKTKQPRMDPNETSLFMKAAAKKGVFGYTSPLHPRSVIVKDLLRHYGCDDDRSKIRAAMSTPASRLKIASDLIALRRERKIGIRMSLTRESDRFTTVVHSALERVHTQSFTETPRLETLQMLVINVYLARSCLSEPSRKAIHENRFPFFTASFRGCTVDGLIEVL